MDLLQASAGFASRIPTSDDYRAERDFCWVTIARAALATGDIATFRRAFAEVRGRSRGTLLDEAVQEASSLRRELLESVLADFDGWLGILSRRAIASLAPAVADAFGLSTAAALAERIADPFTRTSWLTRLAGHTRDRVLALSLLEDAWRAADEVGGDHDYALKHVAGGFISIGALDRAAAAIAGMKDPAIRLDYLDWLTKAQEEAAEEAAAAATAAERAQVSRDNPDVEPQSEVIREAERLAEEDVPGDGPSDARVFRWIGPMVRDGRHEQAIEQVKKRFPTRFCPPTLEIGGPALTELLLFQLASVRSYRRNDLKAEFLVDLYVAAIRRGAPVPAPVMEAALEPGFLTVDPPAHPSIHSRDPSLMPLTEFADFLFDRPVRASDEERRFMDRESEDDPDLSDPAALVRLATALYEGFGEISRRYSAEQVEQGMWYLNWHPIWLARRLADEEVAIGVASECIRAMFDVYADYVARLGAHDSGSSFWMLFDEHAEQARFGRPELQPVLLETIERALALDHDACQRAALHGLNHLHPFPGASEAVDHFLQQNEGRLSADITDYARYCREGRAG